jgi:regulator of sigma E protease
MMVALVLVGLGLLSMLHECGHAFAARALSLGVTDVSLGLGPAWWRFRLGRTTVHLGWVPFGGFVRVRELAPDAEPGPERFAIRRVAARLGAIAGGPMMNYAIAAACGIAITVAFGVDTGRIRGLEVTAVSAHARGVGLQPGDVVERVDGRPVARVKDLARQLTAGEGGPVELRVVRAGAHVELVAQPIARGGRWGFGARYAALPELRPVGTIAAVGHGLALPLRQAGSILGNASQMLVPGSGVRPLSPVGLADRVARSRGWDVRRALGFAAMLSVVVGLFNLLPLPGLDGGRMVIESVEAVLRRRLAKRWSVGLQVAGALLLGLLWIALGLFDAVSVAR